MKQTSGLLCKCDSSVAHCQSQHQCHFWEISLMFKSILHGQGSLAEVNQIYIFHASCLNVFYERFLKSKGSLNDCFENVNIIKMNSSSG